MQFKYSNVLGGAGGESDNYYYATPKSLLSRGNVTAQSDLLGQYT